MNEITEESLHGSNRERRLSIGSVEVLQSMIDKEKEVNSVLCEQAILLTDLHEKLKETQGSSLELEENNKFLLTEIERLEEQILVEKEAKDAYLEEKMEEMNSQFRLLLAKKDAEISQILQNQQEENSSYSEEELLKRREEREKIVQDYSRKREAERDERKKQREAENNNLVLQFDCQVKDLESKVELIGDLKLEYEYKFKSLQKKLEETQENLNEEKKNNSKLQNTLQKMELEKGNSEDSLAVNRREIEKLSLQMVQSQEKLQEEMEKKEEANSNLRKERDSLLEVKKILMQQNEENVKNVNYLKEKLEASQKGAEDLQLSLKNLQESKVEKEPDQTRTLLLEREKNLVSIGYLEKQNHEYSARIEMLEKQNLEMKIKVATLESEKSNDFELVRLLSDEKENLRERIAKLEQEKEVSASDMEEERRRHWQAQSEEKARLLELSSQIINLQEKLFETKTNESSQREQIRNLEESVREAKDLKEKLVVAEKNRIECVSVVKTRLETAEKSLSEKSNLLAKTLEELEVEKSFVEGLRGENGRLKTNLNGCLQELEQLKNKNQKLSDMPKPKIHRTEAVRNLKGLVQVEKPVSEKPSELVPKRVTSSE